MLHPENRLTLIDAMRPPAGFRFESAMAVTFTLDLKALLAAPAALTLTGYATRGGGEPGDDRLEPVEFVHALRSHADRLTVFGQAGEIAFRRRAEHSRFSNGRFSRCRRHAAAASCIPRCG